MNVLRPSQETGASWLAARRRGYLADLPGFGKTPQLIIAANRVGVEHPLVICPAIARDMWSRQWQRWGLPSVTPQVLSYDALVRLEGAVQPLGPDLVAMAVADEGPVLEPVPAHAGLQVVSDYTIVDCTRTASRPRNTSNSATTARRDPFRRA